MPNISLVFAAFIAVSMASLGFVVLRKNKMMVTNQLFFIFTVTVSSWCMFNFLENWYMDLDLSAMFLRLDLFTALIGVFFASVFLFNFPRTNKKFNPLIALFLLLILSVASLAFTDGLIENINIVNGQIGFDFGKWFILYAGVMLVSILSGVIFQVRQYKKANGTEKLQIRYVILGFSITSFIIIILNLFLQNLVSKGVFMLGNFSMIILVVCIFYAMVRYHLMDIWVVLRLGTIFTLSLTTIIFFFVSVNYLLVYFLEIGVPWDIIIPSFFITVGFTPLKKFIEFITDAMFFRRHYKFNNVVQKVEKEIHSAGLVLDKSLSVVNQIISDALKVNRSLIMILIPRGHFISRQTIGDDIGNLELKHNDPVINYLITFPGRILDREELERGGHVNGLADSDRDAIVVELKKISIALVVPIEFKDKLIGIYLLGEKLSEDPFNEEDLRLLQHVSWELSFAIDNARSYEELKHLDEAKSNFIQVVSHQMRTPVTISRCNLELALDKDLNPEEKEGVLKAAYEGVSSLGHQLDQLLTVLEIEEKEMVVKKEGVELNSLINDSVESNRLSIKNKKLKLESKLENSFSVKIDCDKAKIRRVLDIVLLNAINYTPSGGKITINTAQDGFNGKNSLVVSVADNGVGLNDADKVNLFKKFFRSPEAISMFPNGFGLGLFIARKIVLAHGGDIWFENRENQGMTFFFSIPFKTVVEDKK